MRTRTWNSYTQEKYLITLFLLTSVNSNLCSNFETEFNLWLNIFTNIFKVYLTLTLCARVCACFKLFYHKCPNNFKINFFYFSRYELSLHENATTLWIQKNTILILARTFASDIYNRNVTLEWQLRKRAMTKRSGWNWIEMFGKG